MSANFNIRIRDFIINNIIKLDNEPLQIVFPIKCISLFFHSFLKLKEVYLEQISPTFSTNSSKIHEIW